MNPLIVIAFVLCCIWFLWEKRQNDRALASFTAVIHVNGIRGKTSVCRLIDAPLRTKYRVYTKTTGTSPRVIGTDGREYAVRRRGPANISEQLRAIHAAYRQGAEIVILECMAVNPALARVCQQEIVKSRCTVITNVRYDHMFEMGETKEEIAASLAETVPWGGTLYTAETAQKEIFAGRCAERGSRLVEAEGNEGLARAVCRDLGVGEEAFAEGMRHVLPDFGSRKMYRVPRPDGSFVPFLNLFSANDPESSLILIDREAADYKTFSFLYNHRQDRPDRALLFAKHFFPHFPTACVFLMGDAPGLTEKIFRRENPGLTLKRLSRRQELPPVPAGTLLVGIGSIKGAPRAMIEAWEKGGYADE